MKVELPADCPIGFHTIRVATKQGVSNSRPFVVDELAVVAEVETNRTKDTAQVVSFPVVVTGRTDTEASDFFKVKVSAGQTLTFEVIARRIGSPLDPIVVLHDAKTKRELVDLYADDTPGLQSDCRLTHTFKDAGEFLVEVRDTTYRGGADFFYRLRIGEFPGATTAFPVAIERGKTTKVGFAGPGNADIPPVSVKAPSEAGLAAVYVAPKRANGVSGWPVPVLLSNMPEMIEQEPNNDPAKANKLPVPGGVSAKFEKAGDVDHFAVTCKKGVKYAATAMTYEINSPTEVLIRVLDAKGAEIGRSNPAQQNAARRVHARGRWRIRRRVRTPQLSLGAERDLPPLGSTRDRRLQYRARSRSRRSAGRWRNRHHGDRHATQRLRGAGRVECGWRSDIGEDNSPGRADDRVRAAHGEVRDEAGRVRIPRPGSVADAGPGHRAVRHAHGFGEDRARRYAEPAAGDVERTARSR